MLEQLVKRTGKWVYVSFSRAVTPLFVPSKYLQGRWFNERIQGWRWAWSSLIWQRILGFNRHIPWPVSRRISINLAENMDFHVDDLNNFQTFGCYFQNFAGRITIGRGTYVAPNVGIITVNHDPADLDSYREAKNVVIGEQCWIGMNSVILPGVVLGPRTIVGAGSVVTQSFPEGDCVLTGNPAQILKKLEPRAARG